MKSLQDSTTGFEKEREQLHLQMLSAVSHDLKTPLASIIGALEIYERMKTTLPQKKIDTLIETALHEAYRLDSFISNILDIAKIENGMVKLRYEACDLENVIRDCQTKLGSRAQEIDFSIVPLHGRCVVTTDVSLLSRAITCLLENAMKYAGATPKIRVEYFREEGNLTVRVADNGPGIPDDMMEAIFHKYTRLAKKDHQNAGTGLGLSICRGICRLLGGDITVRNGAQGGAIFTLCIPAEAP